MEIVASFFALAAVVCRLLGLHRLRKDFRQKEAVQRAEIRRIKAEHQANIRKMEEERIRRLHEVEELKTKSAAELAALWKKGELDVSAYNKSNPREATPRRSSPSFGGAAVGDQTIYVGPRGGRYRINSQGRKVYDVP